MIPRKQAAPPEPSQPEVSSHSAGRPTCTLPESPLQPALDLVGPALDLVGPALDLVGPALDLVTELAARHGISALSGLLQTARAAVAQDEISLAVFGRFKAGKSSFLNDFIGRGILPVGVVPVTAVVTEIRYGVQEQARVHHRDGRSQEIPLDRIGVYISEKENPENTKQVELIT